MTAATALLARALALLERFVAALRAEVEAREPRQLELTA